MTRRITSIQIAEGAPSATLCVMISCVSVVEAQNIALGIDRLIAEPIAPLVPQTTVWRPELQEDPSPAIATPTVQATPARRTRKPRVEAAVADIGPRAVAATDPLVVNDDEDDETIPVPDASAVTGWNLSGEGSDNDDAQPVAPSTTIASIVVNPAVMEDIKATNAKPKTIEECIAVAAATKGTVITVSKAGDTQLPEGFALKMLTEKPDAKSATEFITYIASLGYTQEQTIDIAKQLAQDPNVPFFSKIPDMAKRVERTWSMFVTQ